MLIQKKHISIALVIVGVILMSSGESTNLQELDSIGRLPEISVTAPRYEYQDEAWLGMVEGVMVEARRPSNSINGIAQKDGSDGIVSGNLSQPDVESTSLHLGKPLYLLLLVTVTFVILSIIYTSLRVYLVPGETKHDRTKH